MYVKKQKTIHQVQERFIRDMLERRYIKNIGITSHFIDKLVKRQVPPELVHKAIHKLCDNICLYIYKFELGLDPVVRVKDFVIKMHYAGNARICLATCYQKSNDL